MSWIKDLISPETREWEEFYRNRFQHDKVVRSTHGVNCTGGCSWQFVSFFSKEVPIDRLLRKTDVAN